MRNWMWIALVAVLVLGGFLLLGNTQQITQPGEAPVGGGPGILPQRREIQLNPINKEQFDQSGRAVLEEINGRVRVTVDVNQMEGLNNQPAHIHAGSCPGVGEILYPLNNVVDGKSITEINANINQLRDNQNPMVVNIHKSPEESSVYTACGELSR